MKKTGLLLLCLAVFLGGSMSAPPAAWPDEAPGALVFEDAGIGSVYLRGEKMENVDPACLAGAAETLMAAVDGHEVSYLKMIIDGDHQIVADLTSSGHILISRKGMLKQEVIVSLKSGEQYFLLKTGPKMYSAGLMPPGLEVGKCVKTGGK